MELLLILMLIIAVSAIVWYFWYLWKDNAKDAERRRVEEQRRIQAQAEADRAAAAAAVAARAESARAAASSGNGQAAETHAESPHRQPRDAPAFASVVGCVPGLKRLQDAVRRRLLHLWCQKRSRGMVPILNPVGSLRRHRLADGGLVRGELHRPERIRGHLAVDESDREQDLAAAAGRAPLRAGPRTESAHPEPSRAPGQQTVA
jgi:hypothetical protein